MKRRDLLTSLGAVVLAGDSVGHPPHAEQRPAPRVLPENTNVRLPPFNATGDGRTDDTAAFASARDTAGVNGFVIVPAGTYVLSGLVLNVTGQTWQLMGGATLLLKPSVNTSLLRITASHVTVEGPGVLDGNLANQSGRSAGISIISADYVSFRNLTARNLNGYGFSFSNCNYPVVTGCLVTNTWYWAVTFFAAPATPFHGAAVTNCRILNYGRGTSSVGGCIGFTGIKGGGWARDAIVGNNILESYPVHSGEHGLPDEPYGVYGSYVQGLVVDGNIIRGGAMGISLPQCTGVTITGNYLEGWEAYGIEIPACSNTAVSGNTLVDTNPRAPTYASVCALIVGSTAQHVSVHGNSITHVAPGGLPAVFIGGEGPGTSDVTVTGNTISKHASGNAGIDIGYNVTHVTIGDNIIDCNGVHADGIWLETRDSYGTVNGRVILGNTIRNYGFRSAILVGTIGQATARIGYAAVQGNVFHAGAKGITVQGAGWGTHTSVVNNVGP